MFSRRRHRRSIGRMSWRRRRRRRERRRRIRSRIRRQRRKRIRRRRSRSRSRSRIRRCIRIRAECRISRRWWRRGIIIYNFPSFA